MHNCARGREPARLRRRSGDREAGFAGWPALAPPGRVVPWASRSQVAAARSWSKAMRDARCNSRVHRRHETVIGIVVIHIIRRDDLMVSEHRLRNSFAGEDIERETDEP